MRLLVWHYCSAAGDAECRDSSGDVEVGENTIELETPYSARDVAALADFSITRRIRRRLSLPAPFVPTAYRYSMQYENARRYPRWLRRWLVGRAADVVLKEGRKLVLVPVKCRLAQSISKICSHFRAWGGDGAAHACLL